MQIPQCRRSTADDCCLDVSLIDQSEYSRAGISSTKLGVLACVSACFATVLLSTQGSLSSSPSSQPLSATSQLRITTGSTTGRLQTNVFKSPAARRNGPYPSSISSHRGQSSLGSYNDNNIEHETNIKGMQFAGVMATATGVVSGTSVITSFTQDTLAWSLASLVSLALGVGLFMRTLKPKPTVEPAFAGTMQYGTSSRGNTSSVGPLNVATTAPPATKTTSNNNIATSTTSTLVGTVISHPRSPVDAPEENDGVWSRQLSSRQVPPSSWNAASYLDIDLPGYVPTHTYAVGIVGAGPAGLALAWQLATEGISVVVVDNQLDGYWPNNYGVWSQEWEACGLPADTIGQIWPKTRIQYTEEEGVVLERPYGRIDREATKAYLLKECVRLGVHFCAAHVDNIKGDVWGDMCNINLKGDEEGIVKCQMPVVAAGHYSPLVKYQSPGSQHQSAPGEWMTKDWSNLLSTNARRNSPEEPGAGGAPVKGSPWGWNYGAGAGPAYQVAYGEEIETDGPHGLPVDEMLLMDWTTGHFNGDSSYDSTPTFLYAMPTDETHIFVEDTSLVARPTVTMDDLKDRLAKRMEHKGIKIKRVIEVEKSVIPLGGPLPLIGHRIIAYGASNNLVHPATGYMVNRAIAEAPELAKGIANALRAGRTVEETTAIAWDVLWPHDKLRTRDFHVFAMEMLAAMDISLIREFFRTFFKDMENSTWKEYLAWSMNRHEMMSFALGVYFRANIAMKWRLMTETLDKDGFSVIRSLLGF
uniref:Lycopene cyclase n=1 Tax=Eutreptiella gymnastica TaxID=73025 RepID=A0A7S1IRE1_9EUGL|mmetsp:Transcript_37706/g.67327  ORF Transcript_37706/g.67327 Transcript_37706/m.67327 type:complete len:756 (+) Transcript_37706:55-2322(+)